MTRSRISSFTTAIAWIILLVLAIPALATEGCEVTVGRLATLEGQVEVQKTGMASWQPGKLDDTLCQGDTVRAAERSRATVVLVNEAVLRIDQNTAMRLDNISGVAGERSALSLLKGALQSFSRKPRGFEISTPYLNGSIEGTEFVFRVEDGESILTVFEGVVVASNDQGSASVSGGESVAASAGQAPQRRTVVQPRDAARWSLYYPPILATGGGDSAISPALRQAADDLSVGRVDEARAGIDNAIAEGTGAGLAYALRSVIEVVQNQREQALADARQGVVLSPDSAAAAIALSYALQANFQIPEARDILLQAVAQHPDDALAVARLSELQLMLGDREQATATAQQAVSLAPELGRTQITLGFAALAEFDNDAAAAAFEKAIALDSADPLPHLGLGLAKISAGHLEAGRSEIEVAVGLGSSDALMRAYLGKAYYTEKRTPLDFQQYEIAKQLDPLDPTAYLYSGIAKQTVNQPVEAVEDLLKSIELNDNRAVYRGRLLLDKDRAARGTSLGRVYNNLGFKQIGINQSTHSLSIDPGNASAHRFLSDTYKDTSGRLETSRVSELLQSELLQDINMNPVQPSVSSTNLNIVTSGGPSDPGFNEFTPLFERNQIQANLTGFSGSNDTNGGEAVLSGNYNSLSGSAGYFKFDTDGYRQNNDLDHEIWDVYSQWALTPVVNLQTEYRHRNTEHGDLDQNFDLDDFDPSYNQDSDEDVYRFGVRVTPGVRSNILLSYINSDLDTNTHNVEDLGGPFPGAFLTLTNDERSSQDADQYEAQYLFQDQSFNLTTGAAYSDVNVDESTLVTPASNFLPPPALVPFTIPTGSDTDDKRLYAYGDWVITPAVTGTVGVSYVDFESDLTSFESVDFDRFNPKVGIRWTVTEQLTARAAYFKNVMPLLASKRTLEPTQVAGFNQFYDDPNATKSTRYGAALDWQAGRTVSLGIEATKRDVDSPVLDFNSSTVEFEDRDEWDYRAYGYWTPTDRWSLSLEAVYDKFENENNSLVATDVPSKVTTWTVPANATYFHPSGWFAGVGATYVDQDVRRDAISSMAEGDSSFTLADASIGYRLPKRRGVVSLAVNNMFDKDFKYQDESYRTFSTEPYVSPYIPETTVMGRVTLSF